MDEKDFSIRLAKLRTKKGVSARDKSLSIGQNADNLKKLDSGYLKNISAIVEGLVRK